MQITWYGHACFGFKWDEVTVLTDPFDEKVGYKLPDSKANLVTVSHQHYDHNYVQGLRQKPVVLTGPGAKEDPLLAVSGVEVSGFPSYHDDRKGALRGPNTIFRFRKDGLSLVHLGDLGIMPEREVLNELQGADYLFIPVGGVYTVDAKAAYQVVAELEPRLVVPMHYKTQALSFELAGVEDFTQLFPRVERVGGPTLTVSNATLDKSGQPLVLVFEYQ